jgi:acyl-CoA dehydrogenase
MISARLGDALSELYLVSAMLKHYEEADRPADELALLDYACQSSLHAAEEALKGVIVNFPVRPIGWLLKLALQPFGVVCRPRATGWRKPCPTLSLSRARRATG